MKRLFDVFFSAAVLVVLSPLLLAVGIAVKLDSPGPVFYRSTRVGRYGRPFLLTKFRTMIADADRQSDVVSTPNHDPRITTVGHLLRYLNFDELPQFFDVLCGHMSVVGPRPEVPRYVAMFNSEERQILSVRPGITDWASLWVGDKGARLSGAQDPEEVYQRLIRPEKLRLQLLYVRTRSMAMDIEIIARTFKSHILDRLLSCRRRANPES